MRGEILTFDAATRMVAIKGDDGNRYLFPATAASTAEPPRRSTAMPASAASGLAALTMGPRAATSEATVAGSADSRMGPAQAVRIRAVDRTGVRMRAARRRRAWDRVISIP